MRGGLDHRLLQLNIGEARIGQACIERDARGPYCGAFGRIDASGDTAFNVAIRTAVVFRDATGRPLYVGKSKDVRTRVRHYFVASELRSRLQFTIA